MISQILMIRLTSVTQYQLQHLQFNIDFTVVVLDARAERNFSGIGKWASLLKFIFRLYPYQGCGIAFILGLVRFRVRYTAN